MLRPLLFGGLVCLLAAGAAEGAPPIVYQTGRVHSLIPHRGLLVVEDLAADGTVRLLRVDVRDAEVVRVSRDPDRPWRWRERPVHLARLPVGTFVVVIGERGRGGAIRADRVEVPR